MLGCNFIVQATRTPKMMRETEASERIIGSLWGVCGS